MKVDMTASLPSRQKMSFICSLLLHL